METQAKRDAMRRAQRASVAARQGRARERVAREQRRAYRASLNHVAGHPSVCVCDGCRGVVVAYVDSETDT